MTIVLIVMTIVLISMTIVLIFMTIVLIVMTILLIVITIVLIAVTIVLMVMLVEGRYYGISERSERGTIYRPSSNMTIKTIVMTIKTIVTAIKTIVMTIKIIVMTIKIIFTTIKTIVMTIESIVMTMHCTTSTGSIVDSPTVISLMLIFDICCFEPMIINSVLELFIKRRLECIQARMSATQFSILFSAASCDKDVSGRNE